MNAAKNHFIQPLDLFPEQKPQIEIIVKVIMTIDLAQVPPTVVNQDEILGTYGGKHGKKRL